MVNNEGTKKGVKRFFSGILILSVSTIIVKVIGLLYKIPMLSYLGAEGMGYFNSAYEIYTFFCIMATTGLPTALSILISSYKASDKYLHIKRIFDISLWFFGIVGFIGTLFLFIFAKNISEFIENSNSYLCIISIAPSLFFIYISNTVRGYFQGLSNMYPTAISQLIEAFGKLFLGLFFARWAIEQGYDTPLVAAFAITGLSLGIIVSSFFLLLCSIIKRKRNRKTLYGREFDEQSNDAMLSKLLKIAFPITLCSAMISTTKLIDMTLIMKRLQDIGYTNGVANEIYGAYTTIAVPIFGLLPSLLAPISLSLVPTLSDAIERSCEDSQSQMIEMSLRLTSFFAIPSSLAIILYSEPIVSLLFSNVGPDLSYVYLLLSLLGASVLFSCTITVTNAILQSYRKTVIPIASMGIGAVIKIVAAYFLIGNPSINAYGAPISTFICDAFITCFNLAYICRKMSYKLNVYSVYIKPLFSACIALASSFAVYRFLLLKNMSLKISFLVSVPIAIIMYFLLSLITKSITDKDIEILLPKIKKTNKESENKNDEIRKNSFIGKEKI